MPRLKLQPRNVQAANHAALAQTVGAGGSLIARAISVSGGHPLWPVGRSGSGMRAPVILFPVLEYVFVLLDVPVQGDVMDDDGCHWDDDDQKKIQKKV